MKALRLLFWMTVVLGLLIATGCGGSTPPPEEKKTEPAAKTEPVTPPPAQPPAEAPAEKKEEAAPPPAPEKKAPPQAKKAAPAGNPVVAMETSKGTIKIELYPDKAPETVANFLRYVDDGFYNGTIFHRVIKGFMIQGGGMTPDMNEKTTRAPIKNESANGLANLRGTIAMARTPDPHSASSQFFINHRTNEGLNRDRAQDGWGYCVFGKVVSGIEVVDAIAEVPTGNKGEHKNVPQEPVLIKSARRDSASAS
jgi:cyclophilin family peptidyl-prolyl cis-trans isomerase